MSGELTSALSVALFVAFALLPLRPRRTRPFSLTFALGWWMNELPFVGLWWLLAATAGALLSPTLTLEWWLLAGTVTLVTLMLARILVRAGAARHALSTALEDSYGQRGTVPPSRAPWWRIMLLPIVAWRPDVRRIRNRRYGPARFGHLLDVYVARRRSTRAPAPVLIYLHGGGLDGIGFGDKAIFAHALPYRFAARGWVGISANYRMRGVRHGQQVDDARAAIDWAREHAAEYGGDPEAIFVMGGSSGANLVASATFSGAPVRGLVALYGLYGIAPAAGRGSALPALSPLDRGTADPAPQAPPALLVHGASDSLVRREEARAFAERVRAVSRAPVVYAELPGADHNFDMFPSLRVHGVGDAIAHFADLVMEEAPRGPAAETGHGSAARR